MSKAAERSLFGLLLEPQSIEELVLDGFSAEFVPTPELRPIYDWAIRQYQISGQQAAPTKLMFEETEAEGHGGKTLYEVLVEHDIDLEVPEETVQWVMEELRARHLTWKVGEWTKSMSEEITEAYSSDRPGIFKEKVSELVGISVDLLPKRGVYALHEEPEQILRDFDRRVAEESDFRGLSTGLPELDAHTGGVHEGELMIIGAPPKGSKSYMIDRIALTEFERGKTVVLYTLENSIAMTRDRIACMATHVDPTVFERGNGAELERRVVNEWIEKIPDCEGQLWILSPDEDGRRPEQMVMEAQIRGADSLLIDQLTFVEPPNPRDPRYLQIRAITHTIKTMISTAANPIPCVMTHQVSRDGIRSARKVGYLNIDDFAEGSEVERTADWALSMWASDDQRQISQFLLQILASRRRDIKNWDVFWNIKTGMMRILNEATLT